MSSDLPPWLSKLSPESREAVRRAVEQAPALTAHQRDRLRLLLRYGGAQDYQARPESRNPQHAA